MFIGLLCFVVVRYLEVEVFMLEKLDHSSRKLDILPYKLYVSSP